jgi:hypothetical protein
MEEQKAEAPPKVRRGWPKGKLRKPRIEAIAEAPTQAPVFVRVRMKGMEPFDIECSQHFVESGFHVFVYPSLRDRFRQTRREIAISEVIDIEITEARPIYDFTRPSVPSPPARILPVPEIRPSIGDGRPVIHSARQDAMARIQQRLEEPVGPEKIDSIPGITLGGSDG